MGLERSGLRCLRSAARDLTVSAPQLELTATSGPAGSFTTTVPADERPPGSTKTHVASIYSKLGVPGRSEAVELMDQLGLARVEAPRPALVGSSRAVRTQSCSLPGSRAARKSGREPSQL